MLSKVFSGPLASDISYCQALSDIVQTMTGTATSINPVFLAQSRLRRRRFDDCIAICTDQLTQNALDQQAWYLKVRAATLKNWVDDTELEEQGKLPLTSHIILAILATCRVHPDLHQMSCIGRLSLAGAGDALLEDASMQVAPRPGTSLSRPLTHAGTAAALRPMTQTGRSSTGFARPGTSSRPLTGSTRSGTAKRLGTAQQRVATALRGSKPGTARPTTTSGRFVRLGTASLASQPGGPFINVDRLNLDKYAQRKHLARVLCDYLLYSEHNAKAASSLCQAALVRTSPEWGRCAKLPLLCAACQPRTQRTLYSIA